MKALIEHLITEIVLITAFITLSSFSSIDMQTLSARRVHSAAINQIQASYYTVDVDAMNEKLQEQHPKWFLSVDELETYNSRKEYRVVLIYQISIPVFNTIKPGIIEGYVR